MKTKTTIIVAVTLLLLCAAYLPRTAAQEMAKQEDAQPTALSSYKVDYTVSELDNGKKVNSRSYSMLIRAQTASKWAGSGPRRLRVGSKVPVTVGVNSTNGLDYLDIGMNIDSRLMPAGDGKIAIGVNWEYSTVENEQEREMGHPVIRHVSSQVESVVPLDKTTIVSEVDDVASTRHYVFEVKVAKISE